MKKKKEFFRIRKDRKRKNGAATVSRFSDKREEKPDRHVFSFLNNAFSL